MFWSTWSGPAGTYISYPGDPQAQMWYLRWVPYSLTHAKNPLFTHFLGWPDGVNVMWNNANAVETPALLLYPVTTVFGVVASLNVMGTLAIVLSAFCAYLVCARYVNHPIAAATGGLLYGFSPYMAAQSLGHIGLTIVVLPPLVFLILDSLLVRRSLSPLLAGALIGMLGAAQLVTSEELVATTAVAGVVALAVLAVLHRRLVPERAVPAIRAFAVAAVVVLVLGAAPLAVQFLGPLRVKGFIRPPDIYVTDLVNFVLPSSLQLIHPSFVDPIVNQFTGNASEWNGYVGVGLLLLLLITAIAFRSRPVVLVMAISAVVIAIFSMGPHLHVAGQVTTIPLPWEVGRIPLLGQILPSRLMLYFYLFAGVLLAVFVDAVLRSRQVAMRVAGLTLLVAALVPLAPAWPYPHGVTPEPAYFVSGARSIPSGSVALVAPYSRLDYDAMQWQAEADMRFRMPEGNYVRPALDGGPQVGPFATVTSDTMEAIQRGQPPPELTDARRAQVLADLRGWQVETVVVGPMHNQDKMLAFFTALYRRAPEKDGGVDLWHGLPPG
jgi:hypothetical protein